MSKTIHFTLSPVQGFVAQARRTKDLWTGSYILSYLIANSMKRIGKENINFPDVAEDALLGRLLNEPTNIELATRLGSLPNRFTATLGNNTAEDCKQAISTAWKEIAAEVKNKIDPKNTIIDSALWDQQIDELWDYQWILGEESYLLDQRKNLRSHSHSKQHGEKCTLCGERSELSKIHKPQPSKINAWWDENIKPNVHGLDLKPGERLCAVCITKRLFPSVASKAIGWEVPEFYPSTAYLSAIDWLINLSKVLKGDTATTDQKANIISAANEFLNVAQTALPYKLEVAEKRIAERDTHSFLQKVFEGIVGTGIDKEFVILDGDVFYLSSIQQQSYQLDGTEAEQRTHRKNLTIALKKLYKAIKEAAPLHAEPSPFYAILFMDGDGMGKLLGNCNAEQKKKVSQALASFTNQVPELVKKHSGILTYAGGDDVFALLSVDNALACATACQKAYKYAFSPLINDGTIKANAATMSAAIEFVHMNTALGVVVKDSHDLLDNIAKEKTGRDSIACRVWKRGGPVLTWSQPWQTIQDGQLIEDIRKAFRTDQPDKFSSKFFYKLSNLFEMANSKDKQGQPIFTSQDVKDLLVMEYLANRQHDLTDATSMERLQKAQDRVEKILKLCLQQIRHLDHHTHQESFYDGEYTADGAMLIRFLSQKEV